MFGLGGRRLRPRRRLHPRTPSRAVAAARGQPSRLTDNCVHLDRRRRRARRHPRGARRRHRRHHERAAQAASPRRRCRSTWSAKLVVGGALPGHRRRRPPTRSTSRVGTPDRARASTSDNVIHSFWVPQLARQDRPRSPASPTTSDSRRPNAGTLPRPVRGVLRAPARAHGVRTCIVRSAGRLTTGGSPHIASRRVEPASELAARGRAGVPARSRAPGATRSGHRRRRARSGPTSPTSDRAARSAPAPSPTRRRTWRGGSVDAQAIKPGVTHAADSSLSTATSDSIVAYLESLK